MRAHQLDPSITPVVVVADAYPNSASVGCRSTCRARPPTGATWPTAAAATSRPRACGLRPNHTATAVDPRAHMATAVDPRAHTLAVRDPDGATLAIGYDKLIIGTGAVPARPPIAGLDLDSCTCCAPWITCSAATAR